MPYIPLARCSLEAWMLWTNTCNPWSQSRPEPQPSPHFYVACESDESPELIVVLQTCGRFPHTHTPTHTAKAWFTASYRNHLHFQRLTCTHSHTVIECHRRRSVVQSCADRLKEEKKPTIRRRLEGSSSNSKSLSHCTKQTDLSNCCPHPTFDMTAVAGYGMLPCCTRIRKRE